MFGTALVGVERRGDRGVEGVGRGDLDEPGDGQREQRGAAGLGAGGGEGVHFVTGEEVEQGGGGDQRGAREVGGGESGDVALFGRDGDGAAVGGLGGHVGDGEVEEGGVLVVEDPVLGAVEAGGEPAAHGAGAAAEVADDQGVFWAGRWAWGLSGCLAR